MKLKSNIALSESGFIFNPATGDSYSANPAGRRILELMKSGADHKQIISTLASEFDVEKYQLEQDLDDFLSLLRQLFLIEDG
ncbi:MAG: PqqD family protein [Cyclobacteriaceae bacterium]